MQEGRMASTEKEPESESVSTDVDKVDAAIRQPTVNTEPRTLDEMTMERAMAEAQKIYAQDPSEDFTKDAIDTATRENAPAKDAGDANSLGRHVDDLVRKAGNIVDADFTECKAWVPTEAPAGPPPTPSTWTAVRPNLDAN